MTDFLAPSVPGVDLLRDALARAMPYMSQVYRADITFDLETAWEWRKDHPPEPWEIRWLS